MANGRDINFYTADQLLDHFDPTKAGDFLTEWFRVVSLSSVVTGEKSSNLVFDESHIGIAFRELGRIDFSITQLAEGFRALLIAEDEKVIDNAAVNAVWNSFLPLVQIGRGAPAEFGKEPIGWNWPATNQFREVLEVLLKDAIDERRCRVFENVLEQLNHIPPITRADDVAIYPELEGDIVLGKPTHPLQLCNLFAADSNLVAILGTIRTVPGLFRSDAGLIDVSRSRINRFAPSCSADVIRAVDCIDLTEDAMIGGPIRNIECNRFANFTGCWNLIGIKDSNFGGSGPIGQKLAPVLTVPGSASLTDVVVNGDLRLETSSQIDLPKYSNVLVARNLIVGPSLEAMARSAVLQGLIRLAGQVVVDEKATIRGVDTTESGLKRRM